MSLWSLACWDCGFECRRETWVFVLGVVSKRHKAKRRTINTKKKVRMKYKTEYKIILKRNPGGGETFRTNAVRPRGPPPHWYNTYSLSFPGAKWPGRGADHSPHLAPGSSMGRAIPSVRAWRVTNHPLALLFLLAF